MQTALEFSFYILAGIVGLGMLMVLVLMKDVFFHGRFTHYLPVLERVPTTALDEARIVLKRLKGAYAKSRDQRQDEIGYEIRHMEQRITALEDRTYADQTDYYDAAKVREKVWREWRGLHEEVRRSPHAQRKALAPQLDGLKRKYTELNKEVQEEFKTATTRDRLVLEELKSQGALEPEILVKNLETPSRDSAASKKNSKNAKVSSGQPGEQKRPSKWPTPLSPYPPAGSGELRQEDMSKADVPKTERTYVDATLSLAGMPNGLMAHVDLSLSSLAEVEMTGLHRYVGCTFIGTDLRRIELKQAAGIHVFQDCNFKGASLAQSRLAGVVFLRCNLSNTHWKGAGLDRVKFETCQLDNIHWEGVDLSRTMVSADMIQSADFSGAGRPPRNIPAETAGEAREGGAPVPPAIPDPVNGITPPSQPPPSSAPVSGTPVSGAGAPAAPVSASISASISAPPPDGQGQSPQGPVPLQPVQELAPDHPQPPDTAGEIPSPRKTESGNAPGTEDIAADNTGDNTLDIATGKP